VDEGTFREDLLYRLAEVVVRMPPLRDHREDIPVLANRILQQLDGPKRTLSPDAVAHLFDQPWSGNVRELRNLVRRAAALSTATVLQRDSFDRSEQMRPNASPAPPPPALVGVAQDQLSLREARRVAEKEYLGRLVARYGPDLDLAAAHAGIHRKSLERLIRQRGLTRR
jgi:DNA-binding NtrC family response regulator